MVSSSLARTRRLLQSRAKMEIRDPAQALRDRISQIKTKEENTEDADVKGTGTKNFKVLNMNIFKIFRFNFLLYL